MKTMPIKSKSEACRAEGHDAVQVSGTREPAQRYEDPDTEEIDALEGEEFFDEKATDQQLDNTKTTQFLDNTVAGQRCIPSKATQPLAGETVFEGLVPESEEGTRLDVFLSAMLRHNDVSREKIKRAIRQGTCSLAGIVCDDVKRKLIPGQQVVLRMFTPVSSVMPEQGAIDLVYKDAFIVVVNKAPGLTVHPCPSCPEGTLVHRLVRLFPELSRQEGLRPGVVHRLDKDTSGLLVVALTEEARMRLASAFAERQVHKEYVALVQGVPPDSGLCEAPLGRDPAVRVKMAVLEYGKPATSEWKVLLSHEQGQFSLVQVRIHTGRTHQIRVHMAHEGYPLFGDTLYAPSEVAHKAPRQMLHARFLSFKHPFTGETMQFACEPPADFLETALRLRQGVQRVVITGCPGCGKSTLTKALERSGAPVWSADAAVTRLYEPEAAGWVALYQYFGDRFIAVKPFESRQHADEKHGNPVDKNALREALKSEPDLRRKIEELIHPLVRRDMQAFWDKANTDDKDIAVAEVPLWFETGWNRPAALNDNTLVVGVHCNLAVRHERLFTHRGWSAQTIAAMDAWQWPDEQKMKACDFVVDNSGAEAEVKALAQNVLRWLQTCQVQQTQHFCEQWQQAIQKA